MFFVYVLRNKASGRHYTGFTSDLVQRLGQHNTGVTKSTKNRGEWELIYQEKYARLPHPCRSCKGADFDFCTRLNIRIHSAITLAGKSP
jgi:hypothetical protein